MQAAPVPHNESERLEALAGLEVLDSLPEAEFDALVQAASLACGAPISLISLVAADRQWFKANVGLPGASETSREVAFCAHAILGDDVFEVPDATQDSRFADNPLVVGRPDIRFYAGAPLTLASGHRVGTLCVIDRTPRRLDGAQREVLRCLARAAASALEARQAVRLVQAQAGQAIGDPRIRALYEDMPTMLHVTDEQGRLVAVSRHWLDRLGHSREQVLGRPALDFFTPGCRELAAGLMQPDAAIAAMQADDGLQMVDAHGAVVDVSLTCGPATQASGAAMHRVSIVQDITARRRAEDANAAWLAAVREQFIMSATDARGVIIEVNDAFCAISKYSRDELVGSPHRIINSGRHAPAFWRAMWQQVEMGHAWRGLICNQAKDGREYWVDSVIAPFFGRDGRIERYVSIRIDVTARMLQQQSLQKSERLLDRTGRLAGVGGWEYHAPEGRVLWSDETCRIHGFAPGHQPSLDEALGHFPPEARARLSAILETAGNEKRGWDLELPLVRADGRQICVRLVGSVESEPGQPLKLVGAIQDITEARRLANELAQQHELLRVTLQSIADAVITVDSHGQVTWMNPVAERMTGWTTPEAVCRPIEQVFLITNEETRQAAPSPVAAALAQQQVVGLAHHTQLISRSGQRYGIEDSAAPIRNREGEILGAVLVFHDVTEQRRLSSEMTYRATHDALTGLVNRVEFESRLRRTLKRAQDGHSAHALLYIDLDQFKLVNDACGHTIGDQLLQQVSRLLQETIRSRDTVARLGGDEFGVILEHCRIEQAQRVAQQVCDRMEDFRFTHDGRRFRIGASIGLVPVDDRWTGTSAILQAADTSCYAAKEAGRNRVHVWFDTDQAMRLRQGEMRWATRIEQALDDNRFVLFWQRIEPLNASARGVHAEVLLRLGQPDGTLIAPGAFLPSAERFHLASRIDRWVLRNALTRLGRSPGREAIESLSINLSGQSVGDRAFHRWSIDALTEAGPEVCARLCLEITETTAVGHMADALQFIQQVRRLQVKVALDDFGAGASSFGYLKTLPVDVLKIDGQFVRDVIDDPLDEAAVRGFIDVARVVGVHTVAEFVDQARVLERLREMGVDFAQGYLIHEPESIESLLPLPDGFVPTASRPTLASSVPADLDGIPPAADGTPNV